MKKGELTFSVLSLPIDFLMLVAAGITTYFFRTSIIGKVRPVLFGLNLPLQRYLLLVAGVSLLFIIAYALSGLYKLRTTRRLAHDFVRIVIASSAGIMGVIVVIFLRQELFDSRFLVLGFWLTAIIFVTLGRILLRLVQRFLTSRYNMGTHRVMIIGNDDISRTITKEMHIDRASGYRVVRTLEDPLSYEVHTSIQRAEVDEVILANPNYAAEHVVELIDLCHEYHVSFKFVPNIHQTLTTNFAFDNFKGIPLIELKRTALDGWGRVMKRAIDIIASLAGLLILLPVFLVIAIIIRLNTKGPTFVGLTRISRNKPFKLYKFRSMVPNAEAKKQELLAYNERHDGPLFKMHNDPRVTRVGRILRRYRIDELPQLYNVLKGDISLVGPRPHQPDEIAQYQKHHKRVLAIKAGVTGMAQISGSSDLPFEEEVALDTLYIENWSLGQDIKILFLTVAHLLFDRSAV